MTDLRSYIRQLREKATASREEAARIRRTTNEWCGAEERCIVRAETSDAIASELETLFGSTRWSHAMMQEFVNEAQQHLSAGRARSAAWMFERNAIPLTEKTL
jgi:hypothetical protein